MVCADQLVASLQGLDVGSLKDDVQRVRLRDALFRALREVQSPWDIAWDQNWVQPATHASVKTLIDAGIFAKWADQGSKPAKAGDLAKHVGADELLISMFMLPT